MDERASKGNLIIVGILIGVCIIIGSNIAEGGVDFLLTRDGLIPILTDGSTGTGNTPSLWIDGGSYIYPNSSYAENVALEGNITNPSNLTWGIYNNGSCIVIGDLSEADAC